jgi:hypothetical protein
MKSRAIAINLDDSFDLVAVWQWEDRRWQLLQLARPKHAIALCRNNSMMRLVFPTGVNPNHLNKESRSRKSKLHNLVLT